MGAGATTTGWRFYCRAINYELERCKSKKKVSQTIGDCLAEQKYWNCGDCEISHSRTNKNFDDIMKFFGNFTAAGNLQCKASERSEMRDKLQHSFSCFFGFTSVDLPSSRVPHIRHYRAQTATNSLKCFTRMHNKQHQVQMTPARCAIKIIFAWFINLIVKSIGQADLHNVMDTCPSMERAISLEWLQFP